MHKPFGRWTTAMTGGILSAASACAAAHLPIVVEEDRVLPDFVEALGMQIPRLKLWSLEESAGIDLTLGADAARRSRSSADIQPR